MERRKRYGIPEVEGTLVQGPCEGDGRTLGRRPCAATAPGAARGRWTNAGSVLCGGRVRARGSGGGKPAAGSHCRWCRGAQGRWPYTESVIYGGGVRSRRPGGGAHQSPSQTQATRVRREAEAVTQFGEECIGGSRTWVRGRHLMATWLEA
jgi:hypothetical protein